MFSKEHYKVLVLRFTAVFTSQEMVKICIWGLRTFPCPVKAFQNSYFTSETLSHIMVLEVDRKQRLSAFRNVV